MLLTNVHIILLYVVYFVVSNIVAGIPHDEWVWVGMVQNAWNSKEAWLDCAVYWVSSWQVEILLSLWPTLGVSNEHGVIGMVVFKGSLRWINIIKKRFLDDGGLIVINHSAHIIAANYVQRDQSLLVLQCWHDPCLELRCFLATPWSGCHDIPMIFPMTCPMKCFGISTKPPSTPSLNSVTFREVWLVVSHFPWFSNTMITTM